MCHPLVSTCSHPYLGPPCCGQLHLHLPSAAQLPAGRAGGHNKASETGVHRVSVGVGIPLNYLWEIANSYW